MGVNVNETNLRGGMRFGAANEFWPPGVGVRDFNPQNSAR